MSSILKTDEIQSQNGGAVVKMQTLKHPSSSSNNITLASTGIVTMASGNGYRLNSIQVFTTVGDNTWTKPPNVNAVLVYVTGGGGGGGAGDASYNQGGGGHGAGTAIKWITSGLGDQETAHVGNFGAGASSAGGEGGTGGTSSFGSHCSATGGEGGRYATHNAQYKNPGSASGVGTSGIAISGGYGGGHHPNAIEGEGQGGTGGASFWGGGGGGAQQWNPYYATHGLAYGSGGGGGAHSGTYTPGYNGKEGIIVVWEYIG